MADNVVLCEFAGNLRNPHSEMGLLSSGYAEAVHRALYGGIGASGIDPGLLLTQALLGAPQGFPCTGDVYLFLALGRVGEDADDVIRDLHEAAGRRDVGLMAVGVDDAYLTDRQLGHERRMVGQDAQVAFHAGHDEGRRILRKRHALGGHYF